MRIADFFKLIPEAKSSLRGAAFGCLVIECLKLGPPFFMKLAIDKLLLPEIPLLSVLIIICLVLVASLTCTRCEMHYLKFVAKNIFTSQVNILTRTHKHLLSLDLHYHEKKPSGESVHLLNSGALKLTELLWFIQDQFLGAFLQIILTFFFLIYVHPSSALLFIVCVIPTIYLVIQGGRRLQPLRKRYHERMTHASWVMNQSLVNVRTVKDYAQETKEEEKYKSLLSSYRDLAIERINFEAVDLLRRDSLLGVARFSVLFYGVYLVATKQMSPGTFVLFATLSEKVIASLYRLGRLYSFLGDSAESLNQLSDVYKEKPTVLSPGKPSLLREVRGKITFEEVEFRYSNDAEIIDSLTLTIPPRSVCALVGRSGAGKSTIMKLIMRHYDPSKGTIFLDDTDIRSYNLNDYRKHIAVVAQDIEIFDLSVHENIAYGSQATRDQVVEAARAAHADQFIQTLPGGYETRLGERGVRLSGGQKQRIGIARALLLKPSVLLFDEATSSLDSESERMIQEALHDIAHQQTMIIIAHRLSTIAHADMIVVLDNGKISEVGTHEELMRNQGIFYHMQSLQASGEIRP
jgi:ATP-binding cassette, subfamily B, bacterial